MKFNSSYLLILLSTLFICSCDKNAPTPNNEKELSTINLIDNLGNTTNTFFLSEIADNIEVIQLEMDPDHLFNEDNIKNLQLTDDFIFFDAGYSGLLKYSRAGKFLQQIGSTGRGPGEYQLLRSYSIDKNKQLIMGYASWKRSLLFYDFNGNFIKSINPSYNGAADYRAISQFGNSFVIVQDPFMPETIDTTQVFNMAIVDNDFNAIKILTNPTYNNRKTEIIENGYDPQNAWDNFYQTTPPIYKIRANSFDFLYYGGDIVYRVTEDFKLDTLYSLKIGDQFPFDVLHFRCHPLEYFNYLLIRDFQETPEYVFFDFGYKKKQYKARCRKDDGYIDVLANNAIIEDKYASERLYTRRREGIKPSFTNDLNGGGSFNPQWADEKYWSICYSAYELMNTNLDSLSTANVKIPQKREQLINIIKNLKETDGPVLMIAHLNLSQNEE